MEGKGEQPGEKFLRRGVGKKGPPQEGHICIPYSDTNVSTLPEVTIPESCGLEDRD